MATIQPAIQLVYANFWLIYTRSASHAAIRGEASATETRPKLVQSDCQPDAVASRRGFSGRDDDVIKRQAPLSLTLQAPVCTIDEYCSTLFCRISLQTYVVGSFRGYSIFQRQEINRPVSRESESGAWLNVHAQ